MITISDYTKPGNLFDGHYQLLRPLSTDGGTADVWLAIDVNTVDMSADANVAEQNTGMLVAIKIYRPKNALDIDGEQRFREEFKIVYECRHENLLQPTSFSVFEGVPYLVLPYCKYGSSEQLIGKPFTSDEIWKFILDVSSGLYRLHTNDPSIIHQDIKPANILIDNNRDYAITDFGISSKYNGIHALYHDEENSGTMAYMAPERFQESAEPTCQSDIWAFGATLYEILTGDVPFGEEGGRYQQENNLLPPPINNIPSDIRRLINDCMALEPDKRPSAYQIRRAALARKYPIWKTKLLYIAVGIISIVFIGAFAFLSRHPKELYTCQIPVEKRYQNAKQYIEAETVDSVKYGMEIIDSLIKLDYIPAIYAKASTYGWFPKDIAIKRRKELLGIDYYKDGYQKGLPKSKKYTAEAFYLFQRILELKDSTYAKYNAYSAYFLACYFINKNDLYYTDKTAKEEGYNYLKQAEQWALLAGDNYILYKIRYSSLSF